MVPDIHKLENYPFEHIHNTMHQMAKSGVVFIDFLKTLKIFVRRFFNMPNDPHPNKLGHKIMADKLYPVLS